MDLLSQEVHGSDKVSHTCSLDRSRTHPGNSSVQIGTTITHGAPHVRAIQHPVDNCSLRLRLMSTVHGLSCWECKLYGRWKGEISVIPTTRRVERKQYRPTRQRHALFQGRGVRLGEVSPYVCLRCIAHYENGRQEAEKSKAVHKNGDTY